MVSLGPGGYPYLEYWFVTTIGVPWSWRIPILKVLVRNYNMASLGPGGYPYLEYWFVTTMASLGSGGYYPYLEYWFGNYNRVSWSRRIPIHGIYQGCGSNFCNVVGSESVFSFKGRIRILFFFLKGRIWIRISSIITKDNTVQLFYL